MAAPNYSGTATDSWYGSNVPIQKNGAPFCRSAVLSFGHRHCLFLLTLLLRVLDLRFSN